MALSVNSIDVTIDPMKNKKQRVTFYIDEEQYLKLRSELVMRKMTVSDWIRERIRRFVNRVEEK